MYVSSSDHDILIIQCIQLFVCKFVHDTMFVFTECVLKTQTVTTSQVKQAVVSILKYAPHCKSSGGRDTAAPTDVSH